MERAIVSARAKREYVEAIYQRYRRAKRAEKRQMLDEFCHVAHYHRKSAIRLLTGPAPGAVGPPRRRDILYTAAAIEALRAIWEAAGYPWSLRLKALLPLWMPWVRTRATGSSLPVYLPAMLCKRVADTETICSSGL